MAATLSSSPPHLPMPVSIIETYSLMADSENLSGATQSPYSAFVVRLTDASLKALNQAVADARINKTDKGALGFVELNGRGSSLEGTLSFGGVSSIVHRFSLADAQRDLGPKGQFEAIEQQQFPVQTKFGSNKTNSYGRMKSLGSVNQRLQISATTEDTFESTKQKAQQASEEMRRNAAKVVLKGPAAGGGAAMKVWHKINKAQASTSQRPLTPVFNQQPKSSAITKTATSSPGGNGAVGDVSKKPLRQRILYKLFVTPMTSSDLLNKLSSEGLSDYDRSVFEKTLNDVARSDSGQIFEVKRSCYSEIRSDDWPYYNTWERQTCRKKLLMLKNPTSQHSGGSQTSGASYADSDDCTQRVSGKVSYRPPPKKSATDNSLRSASFSSNDSKQSPPIPPSTPSPPGLSNTVNSATTNGSTRSNLDYTVQRGNTRNDFQLQAKKTTSDSPMRNSIAADAAGGCSATMNGKSPPVAAAMLTSPPRLSPATTSPKAASAVMPYSHSPKKKARNDGETGSAVPTASTEPSAPVDGSNGHDYEYEYDYKRKQRQQHQRPTPVTSASNGTHLDHELEPPALESYKTDYPTITTSAERRRYKEDFDREYPVYFKLYEKLRSNAAEFEKLGEKLKRSTKDTSEYKRVEKEIVTKYNQYQQDHEMRRSLQEHERLRKKLDFIKERVKEYDDRQPIVPVVHGINDW